MTQQKLQYSMVHQGVDVDDKAAWLQKCFTALQWATHLAAFSHFLSDEACVYKVIHIDYIDCWKHFIIDDIFHHFKLERDITVLKMFFQKSTGPNMLIKVLLQCLDVCPT